MMNFESNRAFEETVMLIHGWAGSKSMWSYVAPRLEAKWKVLQMDLWGHGESSLPDGILTPNGISNDLADLLAAAGSPDCYIVAHSMGCAVALAFAALKPRKVKGVILIEGIYPLQEMFASSGRSLDDETRRSIFDQMLSPHSRQPWALNLINEMMTVPRDVLEQFSEFINMHRVSYLKSLQCPYLIISREQYGDTELSPELWEELGLRPDAVRHVPQTRTHFVIQEQASLSTACILRAVDEIKADADIRLKTAVEEFFSKQAELYFESSMHAEEGLEEVVEILELSPDLNALDLGCGAGHTSFAMAPFVREVCSFDHSNKMLSIVEREAIKRGLNNVTTSLGDVESLTFGDASFDRITSRIAAHHFPNLRKVISGVARVLTDDGLFVLVDNTAPTETDLYVFTEEMEKLKDSSHFHLYPERTWREVLASSGLRIDYMRYYKARHVFKEWAGVASLGAEAVEDLQRRFLSASERVKDYFQIMVEDGQVTSFSIDRLTLRARKQ